ncbi:MAG: hypothetical protein HAW60_01285 [Bdellovibrionales bacterium]|nr:hypothetical protein [Bdellovibrionales bacterium]
MSFLYSLKSFLFFSATLILISNTTKAYVPSVEGLAKLVSTQHGKGAYQIQQKIFFSGNKYTLNETWFVNKGVLKLKSSYKNTFIIYSSNKKQVWQDLKYFISPIGPYFYQRFFLSQNSYSFFNAAKKINLYKNKSFSHLLRFNGKPQYVINNLSKIYKTKTPVKYGPNIIIDNLKFYITQILFKTNTFLQASNYKKFANNLWFPKNIQIFFDKQSVTISTIKIKSISAYKFNQVKYKKESKSEFINNKSSKTLLKFLKNFR